MSGVEIKALPGKKYELLSALIGEPERVFTRVKYGSPLVVVRPVARARPAARADNPRSAFSTGLARSERRTPPRSALLDDRDHRDDQRDDGDRERQYSDQDEHLGLLVHRFRGPGNSAQVGVLLTL